ncbi:ImuA family protein [Brevundimonas aurifodinae]|uniref:Protein ImuA n=1 Tax=Brevundimonas aurifodinae TaxID=1508312 RepID=A0ABV1NSW3_9CAUL
MTPSIEPLSSPVPPPLTDLSTGLEETCVAGPRDMATTLAFALARARQEDRRGVGLAVTRAWLKEHGRPYGPGRRSLCGGRDLILMIGRTQAEALWAMEQALRSGGLALVLGAVDGADLTQTRRLEFAARDGGSAGVLLRTRTGDLSAARRRWRVASVASEGDADDVRAPGPLRLSAELTRSRGERPGLWMLEVDDETHRLRLADRLAGHGHGPVGRSHAA